MRTSQQFRPVRLERLESRRVLSSARGGFALALDLAPRLPAAERSPLPVSQPTSPETGNSSSLGTNASPSMVRFTAGATGGTRTVGPVVNPNLAAGSMGLNLSAGQLATGSTVPTGVTTPLPGLTNAQTIPTTAGTVPGAPPSVNPGLGFNTNLSGISPFVLSYPALGGFNTGGVAYSTVGGFSPVGLSAGATANTFSGVNLGPGAINGVSYLNGANFLNGTIGSGLNSGVGINSAFLGNTLASSAALNGLATDSSLFLNNGLGFNGGTGMSGGATTGLSPSTVTAGLNNDPLATTEFNQLDTLTNVPTEIAPALGGVGAGFITTPNVSPVSFGRTPGFTTTPNVAPTMITGSNIGFMSPFAPSTTASTNSGFTTSPFMSVGNF